MNLTQEQISRLLKLTGLSKNTKNVFSLDSILSSFESLKEADVSGIREIHRSGNSTLHPREDKVREGYVTDPSSLLALSKQKVVGHQIALSGIMHTDS